MAPTAAVTNVETQVLRWSQNLVEYRVALILITLSALLPLLLYLHHEYLAYISLGPGGTPASFAGFVQVKALSWVALKDPYRPIGMPTHDRNEVGYLRDLPAREGHRPVVRGIAPQRQATQKADQLHRDLLASGIEQMASESLDLRLGTSCIEKNGTGLFSNAAGRHTTHRCPSEICHIHASDGSMHMSLHPADLEIVLQSTWGERHPLSRGGRFERFVPGTFVLVYAPRSGDEIATLLRIVRAAAWYVGGKSGTTEQRTEEDLVNV